LPLAPDGGGQVLADGDDSVLRHQAGGGGAERVGERLA
jgi:hypothetical protein